MIDVIVGAGGVAKAEDPLLGLVTEGSLKVMLGIAGKPMVQWALDAIAATNRVRNVVIIGLGPEHGLNCGDKAVYYVPSTGTIFENILAGATKVIEVNPESQLTMWVSADVPLLTPEMLNWFVDRTEETNHELYYQIIERDVMESRFPGSMRTFTRLKGKAVCGGDVSAFSTTIASSVHPAWRKITTARKSVVRQAALVGLLPLIMLITGQMTEEGASRVVRKRLGVNGVLITCPYAEVGMDVDKLLQYRIVEQELERV